MELGALLVGLGNPGKEYEHTRHNMGFMLIDHLLEYCSNALLCGKGRISGQEKAYELWKLTLPQSRFPVLVMKPLTYMNKSGEAVQQVTHYYNIAPERILVIHDELDLPLGRMRLKLAGSSAGHNGIKSIVAQLGTDDFYRLRLGIGHGGMQTTISHVLGKFPAPSRQLLHQVLDHALAGTLIFLEQGFIPAQQFINGFNPKSPT